MNCLRFDSNLFRPVFYGHRFTVVSDLKGVAVLNRTRSAILGLLFGVGPAAVAGLVVAILVRIAINALAWRALSHVSEEVFKAVYPSLTDYDSPASIVFVILRVRVATSGPHAVPYMVRPSAAIRSVTMCCICANSIRNCFSHSATATYNTPTSENIG